ncbi:MAG: LysM peptidoglycan-binding domain-containing protein [Bacteroidota bacterium]
MRYVYSWLLVFVSVSAFAQVEIAIDTIEIAEPPDETISLADTVAPNFAALPSDLEYIPTDETPELLADRLSCLQRTIPLSYNEKVHAFINYFLVRDREYTRMMMRKKDLYFPLFEKELKDHGLPEELKYLAIIESGLHTRAISRARAVGLWQFMAPTGRYLGLKIDWYVDERMDPEKATVAACKYLMQLHSIFKDWELALAAYNSGPGTVRRAIRRSGYKKSFWEIYKYLPRETRAYVPQFVAITYAMNYAEHHNLFEPATEMMMPHDTLRVKQFVHLETLANLTGTCLDDLNRLNPSVQHNAFPDNGRWHTVRLPLDAKAKLNENRVAMLDSISRGGRKETEALAKNAVGNTTGRELMVHRVVSGDVLGTIAERYRVRTNDIREWNRLSSNTIRVGQRLNIWVLPSVADAFGKNTATAKATPIAITPENKTYTVQPGDTLWDISRKFEGLSIEKIKSLNNLTTNELKPGQKLIIG